MVWGVGEDKGDERIASGHSNGIGELTKLYCCQKKEKKTLVSLTRYLRNLCWKRKVMAA